VAMGNPFLGKSVSTYRCSIDVSNADWRHHVTSSIWNLPLHALPGNRTCLPNIDGIGWNQVAPEHENLHRLTYAFITMGSLEVDGRLEELPAERVAMLNRVLAHMDRGHPVHCADLDAFTGVPLPKILHVDYPADSRTARRGVVKHIALFNWSDQRQCISCPGAAVGLAGTVRARDFWSDAMVELRDGDLCEWLPPRSARLYEISG
jgi:hypothetical protein